MLAPVVMGALGRAKREQGLDAGGLASMLGGERDRAMQQTPDLASLAGQLLCGRSGGGAGGIVGALGDLLGGR